MGIEKVNKSAARVMDILLLLSRAERPYNVSDISRELGAPKSSTFEILSTMVDKGFIEVDPYSKHYKLGLKLFEVGAAFLFTTDIHKEARPYLEALMENTGETAFLAIESDGEIVYLDKVEAPTSGRTTAMLGSRNPMYSTGLGKALLASFSDSKAELILSKQVFEKKGANTLKSPDEVMNDLREIRKRGYSIDDEENEEGIYCNAAPVYNARNEPIAAVSVAALLNRMTKDHKEKISTEVVKTALAISKRLGYQKDRLFVL
ncbi:IclR family transcriptional regulator [Fictibacillus terranigra]|uniref:IclR family transcriptional regulator n=1 Tax=Fictibacillus terranigra TaxID=3058424 RepID=A0ABT8EDQ7_9BACL|nr:IclR family transcriptional regulator [Fictibacillus sp. CENA-BCM004]MDN4076025.1 IclR family transcriptional regulator [Fictibacillus sp. CENA-BCM004]